MLEKLALIEVDEEDTSALRLKFPPSPRSGNYPVIMEGVGKTYGDQVVFKNANLTIERGDKVAFVGKNGEGKSTLVKCIMNEIDHEGKLTLGHNVQIGYFAQKQASLLDENLTVFQTIDDVAKGEIRNKLRALLGAFMFGSPEASMKKVKVLSGGERTRLAMIKLLLEPVNFLILDEPTSSLDDDEVEKLFVLMRRLRDEGVGIIFVTHFLEQVYAVCDRFTVLRNGELVGEYETKDLPRVMLVAKMMGKDFDDLADIKGDHKDKRITDAEPVIEAKGLSHKGTIKPFDITINKGEVIGLTGLLGSGRSELVRAIYGADKADTGTIKEKGKDAHISIIPDGVSVMVKKPE